MLNTPPTYAMYIAGLVFQWLQEARRARGEWRRSTSRKAALLYDYLDPDGFLPIPVAKDDRSRMNVPFTLRDASLDDDFLKRGRGSAACRS